MHALVNEYFAEYDTDRFIRTRLFPNTQTGLVVEVGGGTPLFYSMSRHWVLNGWKALIIEPNPHFVKLHKDIGNDVVACACGAVDAVDRDFYVVGPPCDETPDGKLTEHSWSALEVKPGYLAFAHKKSVDEMPHTKIKVQVRTLDSILAERGNPSIDILTLDVEGWELEVLAGFDLLRHRPKVIVLENFLDSDEYRTYMRSRGCLLVKCIEYNEIYVTA